MPDWIGNVVTPAVVASLFALLFNARAEKRREIRAELKAVFDEARALVKEATTAAATYFAKPGTTRTPEEESRLWMADRELRFSIAAIAERTHSIFDDEIESLRNSYDTFVTELTGADFGNPKAATNMSHVRKLAGLGATLRHDLANLFYRELEDGLDQDWLDKIIRFFELGRHYVPIQKALKEPKD